MPINNFPNVVSIATKSSTNVAGGAVVTYSLASSGVPALVTDANARLQLIYAQRDIVIDHVIYLKTNLTVKTGDIVQYGSKNFFITGRLDPSGTGRIFELHVTEVQGQSIIIEQ